VHDVLVALDEHADADVTGAGACGQVFRAVDGPGRDLREQAVAKAAHRDAGSRGPTHFDLDGARRG